jgi:hypothetical protein
MNLDNNIQLEKSTVITDEDDFNASSEKYRGGEFIGIANDTAELVDFVNDFV